MSPADYALFEQVINLCEEFNVTNFSSDGHLASIGSR